MHDYLLDTNGKLSESARKIPELRNRISNIPETSATFTRKYLSDVISPGSLPKEILILLGSWECTDRYDNGSKRQKFVNPNYLHTEKYTDCYVECRCGAIVDSHYDHDHSEECKGWWRLEARAKLGKKQEYVIRECATKYGWSTSMVGKRIGKDGNIGSYIKRFNMSMKDSRDAFRRDSAETYAYFVREKGLPADLIAGIYDRTPSTMGRLVRDYIGERDEMENYRYKKINGQEYGWTKVAQKPAWLNS